MIDWSRVLLVAAALLAGCPGGKSTPTPGASSDLAYPPGPDPDAGYVLADGSVPNDALAAGDVVQSASDGALSGCPNGNLLANLPVLPALCRPFKAPQASSPTPDPPGCAASAGPTQLSAGDDNFVGSDTVKDHVLGMEGRDTLKGMGCSDELNGNQGDDWINGNMGNDKLHGGQGTDTIHGGAGHDAIYGGGGDDTLYGGGGDDTFYYAEGNGDDVVEEYDGFDTIVCAPIYGAPKARLLGWSRTGDDLVLSMTGGGSITVKAYFSGAGYSVDAILGCE